MKNETIIFVIIAVAIIVIFGFYSSTRGQNRPEMGSLTSIRGSDNPANTVNGSIDTQNSGDAAMKLTSDKFQNNEMIPKKYTCLGEDINPSLNIESVPPGTQSLVLIVDDPDSPKGTFTHWVAYDIPVMSQIKENSVPGTIGMNDFENRNYGGPCPSSGTHHYHFKIYALDTKLNLPEGQTKAQIEGAMQGHVLAQSELMGLFTKETTKLVISQPALGQGYGR